MKISMSLPVYRGGLSEYPADADIARSCADCGCSGLEVIRGDTDARSESIARAGLVRGVHMPFWADWVDFLHGDERALVRKFGGEKVCRELYGDDAPECFASAFRRELDYAELCGAEYVVFHVSDVSLEEGYTYRWEHTHEEVIDAFCGLVNPVLAEKKRPFAVLLENQWWPGFTFTEPRLTERLLSGVCFENAGIMLDTGHLLNTNTALRTETDGIRYIAEMLEKHGELSKYVRGIHLHKSFSGEYALENIGKLPRFWPEDYLKRFEISYSHILRLDRHEPWTEPGISGIIGRVSPEWLTHELAAADRQSREAAVKRQARTAGLLP